MLYFGAKGPIPPDKRLQRSPIDNVLTTREIPGARTAAVRILGSDLSHDSCAHPPPLRSVIEVAAAAYGRCSETGVPKQPRRKTASFALDLERTDALQPKAR